MFLERVFDPGRLSSNGKRWWRHIAREFSLSAKETWLKARWLRSTFRSCCFSACGKKCNTCIFLPLFVLWCSCILCCQAIFHHMGPNMARGWEGDSAGTKVVNRFSKPFFVHFNTLTLTLLVLLESKAFLVFLKSTLHFVTLHSCKMTV